MVTYALSVLNLCKGRLYILILDILVEGGHGSNGVEAENLAESRSDCARWRKSANAG